MNDNRGKTLSLISGLDHTMSAINASITPEKNDIKRYDYDLSCF
jgi:hypothetical protein